MFQIIRFLLCVTFFSITCETYGFDQSIVTKEISIIYNNLSNKGNFYDSDFKFLSEIPPSDVNSFPDSTRYQYHYLYGSWLELHDKTSKDNCYHVTKAIELIENSKDALKYGIFDIEYLWLLEVCARYHDEQGNADLAILMYERALCRGRMLEKNPPNMNLRRVKSNCLQYLGKLYLKKGYTREGIQALETAFTISQIDYIPGTGDTEGYFPLWLLGDHYEHFTKEYSKAIQIWERLLNFFRDRNGKETPEYAQILFSLGATYGYQKNYDKAIKTYIECIQIDEKNGRMTNSIDAYGNLFCIYAETGDMEGFIKLKDFLKKYYKDDVQRYYTAYWAASTLLSVNNLKKEKKDLLSTFNHLSTHQKIRSLLDLSNAEVETAPQNTLKYLCDAEKLMNHGEYNSKGNIIDFQITLLRISAYEKCQDFDNAIKYCYKLLDLMPQFTNYKVQDKLDVKYRIANNYILSKQYDRLIDFEKEYITEIEQCFGTNHALYISNLNLLGIGLMYSGAYKKALKSFYKAGELIKNKYGEAHVEYTTFLHNVGRTYMLKGDINKARILLSKSRDIQLELTGSIDPKTQKYLNELQTDE